MLSPSIFDFLPFPLAIIIIIIKCFRFERIILEVQLTFSLSVALALFLFFTFCELFKVAICIHIYICMYMYMLIQNAYTYSNKIIYKNFILALIWVGENESWQKVCARSDDDGIICIALYCKPLT